MGVVDRLFDAMKATVEMRGDIDRNADKLRATADAVLDHEKRLIRIETLVEFSTARSATRRLPRV